MVICMRVLLRTRTRELLNDANAEFLRVSAYIVGAFTAGGRTVMKVLGNGIESN